MKIMITALSALLLCTTISMTVPVFDITTSIIGKWEVQVKDAPEGYQDYIVDVKKQKGEYTADITGSGTNLKNQALTLQGNAFTANIYVEEPVQLTLWEEKGIVKGSAQTSSGKLALHMKKISSKK
ncbi:MAG: hypothetical protein KF862_00830 [Chitinophagaceae bacterium]|nr:hypothetical protein [Chitinophagaceae bacterium]